MCSKIRITMWPMMSWHKLAEYERVHEESIDQGEAGVACAVYAVLFDSHDCESALGCWSSSVDCAFEGRGGGDNFVFDLGHGVGLWRRVVDGPLAQGAGASNLQTPVVMFEKNRRRAVSELFVPAVLARRCGRGACVPRVRLRHPRGRRDPGVGIFEWVCDSRELGRGVGAAFGWDW